MKLVVYQDFDILFNFIYFALQHAYKIIKTHAEGMPATGADILDEKKYIIKLITVY